MTYGWGCAVLALMSSLEEEEEESEVEIRVRRAKFDFRFVRGRTGI
jgi:hypothetical protein